MTIKMIAAVGMDNIIGIDNDIPWYLPEDFQHFKKTTETHDIIMGSKTWDSLPRKPLPNRRNIILSRTARPSEGDVLWMTSIDDVIAHQGQDPDRISFVIGGGEIYTKFMPHADELIISRVHDSFDVPEGSNVTRFPDINEDEWKLIHSESRDGFDIETYRRP